jgi:molybdopterin synthase catalytic subunit
MFVKGSISKKIVESASQLLQEDLKLGSQLHFMGQVRADNDENSIVKGITYSAYEEMAEAEINKITIELINKYELDRCQIFHSIGYVAVGEWSLFIIMGTKHRKNLFSAMDECVILIKKLVPIWKKETFSNKEEKWK